MLNLLVSNISKMVSGSNFKTDVPVLTSAKDYSSWRYQLFSILDGHAGLRDKVEMELATAGSGSLEAADNVVLQQLKGALVSKLQGDALQAAQLSNARGFCALIKVLDGVFRPDNLVERQRILVDCLSVNFDEKKESLASFLSTKENALRNRLKTITVDDLLMLSWTTLLPRAYSSVCSEMRSTPGILARKVISLR